MQSWYDREFAMIITEFDAHAHFNDAHNQDTDWTDYKPAFRLMNGRAWPDTIQPHFDPMLPNLLPSPLPPGPERLRSVIARLSQVPRVYAAARQNLTNPPKELTDVSVRMARGSVGFLEGAVVQWAKTAAGKDADLLKSFEKANDAVVRSLTDVVAWMKKDLLPKSTGKYALGADTFAKQLLYEELLDIPLDKLLPQCTPGTS